MTAPLSPVFQAALEKAMAHDFKGARRQGWTRTEPGSEAEAQRWLDAHPVDPALEAVGEWEDAVADRLYDEPGDPLLDREPMGGDPRWAEGI